ncbi:hypothetical protein BXZ70DRAFT_947624 [Cristinia sonorae]|uniref:DUF6593 domain-containing protein n=1 Tax=Cristinia sonorae TaxID=1940300 RepID=A0A8K0UK92_9AGAR|nr:hypothetical protein BXZ70DRAFT_947624 [Cristinia sonorae]
MDLHLSYNSIARNILFANTPDGATPLYHIYTPQGFTSQTTTISRISPLVAHDLSNKFLTGKKSDIKEWSGYPGGVEVFARIHWTRVGSIRIEYEGRSMEADNFIPRSGFLWRNRSFTAPDGLLYTWTDSKELTVKKNGLTGVAARYRDAAFLSNRMPRLEIMPGGMHMVDVIVLTWLFVETVSRGGNRDSSSFIHDSASLHDGRFGYPTGDIANTVSIGTGDGTDGGGGGGDAGGSSGGGGGGY